MSPLSLPGAAAAAWRTAARAAPRVFLACLVLCAASGVLLAFQYRPMGNVLRSVEHLTTLAPYGFFFRRLHYASGQACALLALAHVVHHFLRAAYRRSPARDWLRLAGGLAVCLLLLLTGFILKADHAAVCAGTVLRSLVQAVPLAGPLLADAVLTPGEAFFLLPYLHHCLALPLALGLLLRGHVRAWLPEPRILAGAGLVLGAWALAAPLPLPVLPAAAAGAAPAAHGPWFFLGLQELLRTAPPLLGGVVLPALYLGLFCALPLLPRTAERAARGMLLGGAAAYALLGLKAAFA